MNSRISEALSQLKQFDKNVSRSSSKSSSPVAENFDERWLDQFYVDFENRFRGTKEDILRKQSAYLPYLQKSGLNFKKTPVLDLGCGRGEWLTSLKNINIVAKRARQIIDTRYDKIAALQNIDDTEQLDDFIDEDFDKEKSISKSMNEFLDDDLEYNDYDNSDNLLDDE